MILVTGATGFIGRSLMRALHLREMPARALTIDIRSPQPLIDELADVDTVIHLASAERQGRLRRLQSVDLGGTDRLLKTCRQVGVRRFIFVSRIGADPLSMYSLFQVKGKQERLVQQSELPYTIIRATSLYGRHDAFLNHVLRLARWSYPFVWLPDGGLTAMQPLWVEDLVRGILQSLAKYDLIGQVIEIGGEERLSYQLLVQVILQNAGMVRYPLKVPSIFLRHGIPWLFGWSRYPLMHRFFLQRLAVPDIADINAFYRFFGFHPTPLRQNLAYLRQTN